MLYHAGTLAIGYGTLGAVVRKLVQTKQKRNTRETMKKLRAFSAARNPTLSIDPYLDDTAQEKELESIGLPELPVLKAAQDNPDLFAREFGGTHDPAHLALAAVASIASVYGGWRLMDYSADRERGEELDTRVSETKNMIDKLVFDEIQRTRGPQKSAAFTAVCGRLEKESQNMSVEDMRAKSPESTHTEVVGENTSTGWGAAGDGVAQMAINPFRSIQTGWWLWAAATFALSYAAAKRFGDSADPNRKRLKEIEDIAEERAKSHEAPVLLDESSFAPPTAFSGRAGSPNPRSTAAVPVQGVKTKTPVDATDPYASILK
jgi:hypothetical protein